MGKLKFKQAGPWDTEPDVVRWTDGDYEAEMLRHDRIGHWCGYVTVPEGHPWAGRDWTDIPADVHGGITYVEGRKIGFDCCHLYDAWPGMPKTLLDGAEYRDQTYVRREVEQLLKQAKEAAK